VSLHKSAKAYRPQVEALLASGLKRESVALQTADVCSKWEGIHEDIHS